MIKTTIFISTALVGALATSTPTTELKPSTTAEQTRLPLPKADNVVAQFSYLELSHDMTGFSLSVTDKTAVFVDVEFPGDLHIRVGF